MMVTKLSSHVKEAKYAVRGIHLFGFLEIEVERKQ